MNIHSNDILCGDSLDVMIAMDQGQIDIVYIDPPFNTGRVFSGAKDSVVEGTEFRDIYNSSVVKQSLEYLKKHTKTFVDVRNISTKHNEHYMIYMASRLLEIKKVTKMNGIICYHCDPSISHYIKVLMDRIFGEDCFLSDIVWKYNSGGASKKKLAQKHDNILVYKRSSRHENTFNIEREPYSCNINAKNASDFHKDGKMISDVWDMPILSSTSKERTGYPTQKPIRLLERLISIYSNEGDIVLDAFCGSGTTLLAAKNMHRRYLGIDISSHAVDIAKQRTTESNLI